MSNQSGLSATIYDQLVPRELSKADVRKIEILRAAIQIYAGVDIQYVSYEDIAREAEITRPLVNHHFPDKEELFTASMKLIRAEFQQLAVEEIQKFTQPIDQLKAYVRVCFTWIYKYPIHFRAWVFFFYICMNDAKQRKLHKALTDMGMRRIEELLASGARSGDFSDKDFASKAKAIQRIITGSLIEIATEFESRDKAAHKKIENETVKLCLGLVRK